MTKDKIEDYVKKAAKEAELTEDESRKLADELLKHSEETKQQIDKKINDEVKKIVHKLGVATQEDLKKIQKQLDKLQSLLSKKTSK